ncbi:YceI family protein [Tamlana flava]|uniref:YceI family protein n=1 Tax=Tamlana flava TaxID=3158572 RepID=UPI00351BDBED
MKTKFATLLFITALATVFISCKDKAKEAKTTSAETPETTEEITENYKAKLEASYIDWKGFKPTGEHFGTIELERGSFEVADGKIVGGSFVIDMHSITVKDLPADDKKNARLAGHLKSPDFFDVDTHPSAGFTITGLEEVDGKMMLSGNLSLKDTKNNVTFPVSISHEGEQLVLESETFTIDRSKWNVKHGSKSFFDNLGDKFINDDIELKIMVKAAKS